jgi:hypothetical protein
MYHISNVLPQRITKKGRRSGSNPRRGIDRRADRDAKRVA